MAYWTRSPEGRVRVFISQNNRISCVPRAKCKHLDFQPDDVVQRFVESLGSAERRGPALTDAKLTELIESFSAYEKSRRLNPATIKNRASLLQRFVVPFYLGQSPPIKDPNYFHTRCIKLYDYLIEKGVGYETHLDVNTSLKKFYKWLSEEGIVSAGVELKLRSPVQERQDTPLQFSLTPAQVLQFAEGAADELAFMALAGYFFSLRTQEVLALRRSDFRAGTLASQLESCRVMQKAELFDRFAVNISKQHSKTLRSSTAAPKAGSKGWVACFDKTAAEKIIALIKSLDKGDKPLVNFGVEWNLNRWRENGIENITMKDLRRASLYWLGHHTQLGLIELKSHARHSKSDTTLLYLRRPNEELDEVDDLNLEA